MGILPAFSYICNHIGFDTSSSLKNSLESSIFFFADNGHDLLSVIKAQVSTLQPYMYLDQGIDGFPAFGILPSSDIKAPYRAHLPERLYREFVIVCTVSVKSKTGGFVFAVMNPTETVRVHFSILR